VSASIIPQRIALHALIAKHHYRVVNDCLTPWFFYNPYGDVWTAALSVCMERNALSRESVIDWIRKSQFSDSRKSATMAALEECISETSYDLVLLPRMLSSEFQKHCEDNLKIALEDVQGTGESRLEAVTKAHEALCNVGADDQTANMNDLTRKYFDAREAGEEPEPSKRSINFYDEHLKFIFRGRIWPEPVIIAAPPRMSKTQLLLNIVNDFSSSGRPGKVYSFEDSSETFSSKLLAVDVDKLRMMKDELYTKHGKNVYVDPKSYTFEEFARVVRRDCLSMRLDWIACDFIQCFKYQRRFEHQEISEGTKIIRELSKTYELPIIMLSQVRRTDGAKGDKKDEYYPSLHDLRGSGSLEEDSRAVYIIGGSAANPVRRITVAKNSHGPLVEYDVEFDLPSGRIISARQYFQESKDE
jgi:replicative DNA helicase